MSSYASECVFAVLYVCASNIDARTCVFTGFTCVCMCMPAFAWVPCAYACVRACVPCMRVYTNVRRLMRLYACMCMS